MTDNEDYNPSLNEGLRLHLEATDTSFINTTILDTSGSGELDSSLANNNVAPSSINTNAAAKSKPIPDERKINTPKKRRKKETVKTGNLIPAASVEDSSLTESAKSTNGIVIGLTNSPSPSQAKISDDFTTCSFLINLDGSALHPDNENDNTEGQNESFGAENLSCSMLSCNVGNEIENISSKVQVLQNKILEKDEKIEEMARMLEIAMRYKENQEMILLRIAEDSGTLEDRLSGITVCRNPQIHENGVGAVLENTLDQFELSSYLNPPSAHSLLISRPEMSQKETQTCPDETTVPKSVGVTCDISTLTPSIVQQKCHDLQLSSQTLRSEINSLKYYVSEYFKLNSGADSQELVRVINVAFQKQNADLLTLKSQYSKDIDYQNNIQIQLREELDILKIQCEKTLEAKDQEIHVLTEDLKQLHKKHNEYRLQQENEIQTVQLTNEGIIKNKNDEIRTLIAKNSRIEETLKNFNSDKKKEIEQIKLRSEENLRIKNEEIRSLRLKVSQFEEAKRNEHKLNSLSSRLSPEGSELEGDASMADSTSGAESHYRLTRTKIDYLKLTPPVECIDDGEILEQSSSSDIPNSVVEDLKLQLMDMEKKYDANRKYLDEQTIEREQERDEYHRTIEDYRLKSEDCKKENDRLISSVANQKHEIGDYEIRLKDAVETEQDLMRKCERVENELKSAVDKIFELREIVRDLEEQIDTATVNAIDLKEQNQMLSDELDRLEILRRDQDDAMNTTQDTVNTLGGDMVEELQTQLGDITRRLEKKLNEMDNFPWQTRPNSSCSGAISVSTEDVSVREFSYINRDKECDPKEAGPLLCDGLRRLDTHFENFVRFQEIIVKKLQDADLRVSLSKKRIEDFENEKLVYQENAKSQINTIADLESRLDQFRFEPSPSAVTLSGLRARVSSLSEECDQYKGNLELRTYELQDAIKRQAATQAMLEQYKKMTAQTSASQVSKNSVQTQSQTNIKNSFAQTDKVVKNVSTKEACVQTNEFLKNAENYKYFNRQSFELSTIPGGPPPTFSTPNDVVNIQKSSIKSNNLANAWSFLGSGDGNSEIIDGTPETARNRGQPSLLALSGEKSIERFSNKSVSFNMKTLNEDQGDKDRPRPNAPNKFDLEADESFDFLDDKPGKSGGLSNPLQSINGPKAGEAKRLSGEKAKDSSDKDRQREEESGQSGNLGPSSTDGSNTNGKNRKSSGRKDGNIERIEPDDEDSKGRRTSNNPNAYDTQGRKYSGNKKNSQSNRGNFLEDPSNWTMSSQDDESGRDDASNYEDDIHSDSSMDERRKNSKQKRSLHPDPLDESDDERMRAEGRTSLADKFKDTEDSPSSSPFGELNNAMTKLPANADYLTEGSKDEQIKRMLKRIAELEDELGDYFLGTRIKVDENGEPILAESILRDGLGDVAKDSTIRDTLISPVKRLRNSDSNEVYQSVVTSTIDYDVDDQGRPHILSSRLSNGEDPDSQRRQMSDPNAAQRGRIADTDMQVEIASLQCQVSHLQTALMEEIDKNQRLAQESSQPRNNSAPNMEQFPFGPPSFGNGGNQPHSPVSSNMIQRSYSMPSPEAQLDALSQQLQASLVKEAQLSASCQAHMTKLQKAEGEYNDLKNDANTEINKMRKLQGEKEKEIARLRTQLEVAGNQLHQVQTRCNELIRQSESTAFRQKLNGMNYLDLYLKTRSFRKALIWQKKYLLLTIQGYKDILRASGIQYDPDLLQKEIVIAPSSVGLADRKKPLTRFKIVGKALVAIARMKYMVNRWESKSPKLNSAEESPAAPSTAVVSRTVSKSATTPPTRDLANASSANTSVTNIPLRRDSNTNRARRSVVNPRFPSATVNPIEFSTAPSTSIVQPTASGNTVLSQYLDRFNYLENQLGSSLGRDTNRPPDHEHDE